ncbi:MAG: helix-turn-helix transcriptional regulator [Deltaproteobacteria bacterium]|nr:helix-turn-helix transcriptional regulator [Deltaproteobacteria bacterium]
MAIAFDRSFGAPLRVRRWDHSGPALSWPGAAHPAYELAAVESGEITYQMGATTTVVAPGQVVAVPIQVEHQTRIGPNTRARSLWIGPDLIAELSDTLGHRLAPELGLFPAPERLLVLLGLLSGEAERDPDGPGSALAREGLLDALLVELYRGKGTRGTAGKDAAVLAVLERIERDYAEPLSLADLAETGRVSRFELSRRFRRATGTSPYQHLLEVRCRRAAEHLGRGRVSVTEAAYLVGFTDLGRFSRAFRQVLGCRPSAYRGPAQQSPIPSQEAPSPKAVADGTVGACNELYSRSSSSASPPAAKPKRRSPIPRPPTPAPVT